MKTRLNHVIELLSSIKNLLTELVKLATTLAETRTQNQKPLEQRHIWTKEELQEKTNMSEPTYNRNLKKELLNPMRLGGADMYFEEDILKAMEESRRKGKI